MLHLKIYFWSTIFFSNIHSGNAYSVLTQHSNVCIKIYGLTPWRDSNPRNSQCFINKYRLCYLFSSRNEGPGQFARKCNNNVQIISKQDTRVKLSFSDVFCEESWHEKSECAFSAEMIAFFAFLQPQQTEGNVTAQSLLRLLNLWTWSGHKKKKKRDWPFFLYLYYFDAFAKNVHRPVQRFDKSWDCKCLQTYMYVLVK
jgi:hypothetical protein